MSDMIDFKKLKCVLESQLLLRKVYQRKGMQNLHLLLEIWLKFVLDSENLRKPITTTKGHWLLGISSSQNVMIDIHLFSQTRFGENHCELAKILNNKAHMLLPARKYKEAEGLYIRVLNILKVERGENHSEYGIAMDNLGKVYMLQQRHAEAEVQFLKALEIKKNALGTTHHNYAVTLDHLTTNRVHQNGNNNL